MAKAKLTTMQSYHVRDAKTNRLLHTQEGVPIVVKAFTIKAAKHRAKTLTLRDIVVEKAS